MGVLQRDSSSLCNIERRRSYHGLRAAAFSTATRFQTIRSTPRTTSLTDLWPVVLGLHQPSSHHALVPPALSGEGFPVLITAQVRCCFNHITPVMPLSEAETSMPHGRNTTTTLLPWGSPPLGSPIGINLSPG